MRHVPKLAGPLMVAAALLAAAPEAAAQMARISGRVVDGDGNPIAGATLTVTTPDSEGFELVKTTNKKGAVTLAFANVEWRYILRIEKEGYLTRSEQLNLTIGGTMREEWVLVPGEAASTEEGEKGSGEGGGGNRAVRTYNEGVEAQRVGDLDLAEAKYREAAEMAPGLAAPRTALSAVAFIRKDWDTAAAEAEAALAIDPGDVRAMQLRFDAYRLGGNEEKATEAADELRKLGSLDQAAGRIYNEGVDAFSNGDTATAISKFQQVVQLDPDMVNAYVALAQIHLSQGAPAEAAAMAKQALDREPDNDRALKLGFDAARMTGDTETEAANLERLVEVDPEWLRTVLLDHAGQLFNANEPAQAALELQYIVKADPELARAHFMLGMALYNTGRVEEGRQHLETFIELAPDDPDVEIARGLLNYTE